MDREKEDMMMKAGQNDRNMSETVEAGKQKKREMNLNIVKDMDGNDDIMTECQWMKMQIESRSENEEFARVTIAVFMSRMDPTLEEVNDVKTAVSEAVTNCVIHGYGNGRGTIYIEAGIEGNELTVSIRDEGRGIDDIKKAMEPMYTSDTSGERSGMGFSFMEAFMDQVAVNSEPGRGTMVIMKKKIGR